MKPLAVIVFLILAVSLALYAISKAPQWLEPLQTAGKKSLVPKRTGSGAPFYYSYAPQLGNNASSGSYLSSVSDYQIPKGFTRADLSPYFGKVRVNSAFASVFGGQSPEIRLYSSLISGETADISGWKLKSNRGEITITQAVAAYDPSGFAASTDINLKNNQTVIISGGRSPLSRNFRLNKCTGFLNALYTFNPPLPQNCPLPSEQNISNLSGQCQNYIRSLGSCALPNPTVYNSFPGTAEGNACRNFLNSITYKSCYEAHQNDEGFYSNEWRLWANQNILDAAHDTVRLYDRQGLLVDQYQY